MPFEFERLEIPDVVLVKPECYHDGRGYFLETYKEEPFAEFGIDRDFVQDNHSRSKKHVLRGLHYQEPPHAQGKLVRAVRGEVFDVAVDIRQGSPSYKRWVGEVLSEDNHHMLYIPPGFAHGFCVLSDTADFVYKVTDVYAPECEGGIRWDDPAIDIEWPVDDPIVSEKDRELPYIG